VLAAGSVYWNNSVVSEYKGRIGKKGDLNLWMDECKGNLCYTGTCK